MRGQLARTVLREPGHGNALRLPDSAYGKTGATVRYDGSGAKVRARRKPREEWLALQPGAHEGDIAWDHAEANRKMLSPKRRSRPKRRPWHSATKRAMRCCAILRRRGTPPSGRAGGALAPRADPRDGGRQSPRRSRRRAASARSRADLVRHPGQRPPGRPDGADDRRAAEQAHRADRPPGGGGRSRRRDRRDRRRHPLDGRRAHRAPAAAPSARAAQQHVGRRGRSGAPARPCRQGAVIAGILDRNDIKTGNGNRGVRELATSLRSSYQILVHRPAETDLEPWLNNRRKLAGCNLDGLDRLIRGAA